MQLDGMMVKTSLYYLTDYNNSKMILTAVKYFSTKRYHNYTVHVHKSAYFERIFSFNNLLIMVNRKYTFN